MADRQSRQQSPPKPTVCALTVLSEAHDQTQRRAEHAHHAGAHEGVGVDSWGILRVRGCVAGAQAPANVESSSLVAEACVLVVGHPAAGCMRLEKRGKGELLRLLATYDERQSLDEVGAHGHDVCRRDQRAADRRLVAVVRAGRIARVLRCWKFPCQCVVPRIFDCWQQRSASDDRAPR